MRPRLRVVSTLQDFGYVVKPLSFAFKPWKIMEIDKNARKEKEKVTADMCTPFHIYTCAQLREQVVYSTS